MYVAFAPCWIQTEYLQDTLLHMYVYMWTVQISINQENILKGNIICTNSSFLLHNSFIISWYILISKKSTENIILLLI